MKKPTANLEQFRGKRIAQSEAQGLWQIAGASVFNARLIEGSFKAPLKPADPLPAAPKP